MINFVINFLLNTIGQSSVGAQLFVGAGIVALVGVGFFKLSKVIPLWYRNIKSFILDRERKKEEADRTQQRILANQDNILNNYKNVESLNRSVADIAKLTNKIADEYRQISEIVNSMIGRLDSLETEVPELRKISDHRDNELILTIKNQTNQLQLINDRIERIGGIVDLLNDSDTEKFRHKLMDLYERSISQGHQIELHTYQDLYKGFERYRKQGGNSYAEDIWNEIGKCKKVIEHRELYPNLIEIPEMKEE